MTDEERTPIDSVQRILEDLRNTTDPDHTDPGIDAPPSAIDLLLEAFSAPAGTPAAEAVDAAVLGSVRPSLPLERRTRLLEVLDVALANRRQDNGQLQSVLRRRRYAVNESLVDLTARLNEAVHRTGTSVTEITATEIEALESGRVSVTDGAAIINLSAWAVVAGLPRESARLAFSRSIEAASDESPMRSAAGSARKADRTPESEEHIARFLYHYDAVASAIENS